MYFSNSIVNSTQFMCKKMYERIPRLIQLESLEIQCQYCVCLFAWIVSSLIFIELKEVLSTFFRKSKHSLLISKKPESSRYYQETFIFYERAKKINN